MQINKCLIYYTNYNIIILNFDKYFDSFINQIIKNYFDWNFLEKKINPQSKLFKFFLETELDKLILTVKEIYNKENSKIYIVYTPSLKQTDDTSKEKLFLGWLSDYNLCLKKTLYFLKKKTKYLKCNSKNLNFTNFITRKNINYGVALGEEIEFLQSLLDK